MCATERPYNITVEGIIPLNTIGAMAKQKCEMEAKRQADLAKLNSKYVNSLSWRVTVPLRAVGRFFKAGKAKTKN